MSAARFVPCLLIPLWFAAAPAAFGQAAPAAGWTGEGELGLAVATGNTATRTLSAKLKLGREIERWRHGGSLEVLQAETAGVTTADRYVLAGKSDYKIDPTRYGFAALRHEDDRFAAFTRQTSLTGGFGDRLFDDGTTSLDLSVGLGLRRFTRAGGAAGDDVILRLGGVFGYRFSPQVSFGEELLSEAGRENTYVESASSLSARLGDRLAAKLVYLVKHNSTTQAGTEDTDTLTTASLVYSF